MKTRTVFTKAVAAGNDFIIIDNREKEIPLAALRKLSRTLCRQKESIGADGLLVVESSVKADFKMRILNPDGSVAEMCGNGSRCIALYAAYNRIAGSWMRIETKAGLLNAAVRRISRPDTGCIHAKVKVLMTDPLGYKKQAVKICGKKVVCHSINTGVPHAIVFVSKVGPVDVEGIGRALRFHPAFAPRGTNVDFVQFNNARNISVRTFERGVEGETKACGTGSVASALISSIAEGAASPCTVITKSGERLKVYFSRRGTLFTGVHLEGSAHLVFNGTMCGRS